MARYGVKIKVESAPPLPPPPDDVVTLRRDVRFASITQFVGLFKKQIGLGFDFKVEDLEYDLAGERANTVVPNLMGKLCSSLANDKNTNSTNWLASMRRAYDKRLAPQDNPFYSYEKVPVSSVAGESKPEPSTSQPAEPGPIEPTEQDNNVMQVDQNGSSGVDGAKAEEGAITAEPAVKDSEAIVPEAEAITEDETVTEEVPTASTSTLPVESTSLAADPMTEGTETTTTQRTEVAWESVDLSTKVQAIYNICEWHMDETDRFRKSLKASFDEDQISWRVEPIGKDAKGFKYFYLEGPRLWVQRIPPKKRKEKGVVARVPIEEPDVKGKGKAKEKEKEKDVLASPAAATNGRKRNSRSLSANGEVQLDDTPNKRSRRSSRRDEVWQEIPEELLKEWGVDQDAIVTDENGTDGTRKKREGSGTSSPLTSIEDEEDQDKEASAIPVKRGMSEEFGLGNGETRWEDDYWAERDRIEGLDSFVEWEAICITLEDWEAIGEKFAKSSNANELDLHQHLNTVVLAEVRPALLAAEKARQQEYLAMIRKRSTRIASKESEEEERQRLAALKVADESKASRASRHKTVAYDDIELVGNEAITAAASTSATNDEGYSAIPPHETREERLRKREEEKKARELAQEQAQIEAAKLAERQAAIEANGGVLPPGMETDEEIEAKRLEAERIAREEEDRVAAEAQRVANAEQAAKDAQAKAIRDAEVKAAREAEKLAKKKQQKKATKQSTATKRAQEAAAALLYGVGQGNTALEDASDSVEEPWYFDCEVCKRAGWNYDDGHQVMCCEQCQEWQHVACHVDRDQQMNRPVQHYTDDRFAFYCSKCRADPRRRPRKVPARLPPAQQPFVPFANLDPPAPAKPIQRPAPAPVVKQQRSASQAKSASPRSAAATQPAQTPKTNGYSHAGPPPPSMSHRPAPPQQAVVVPPPQAQPKPRPAPSNPNASLPAPGQPSLSYPALKDLIESNPVLINQLPPQYQAHFSQLLGIPVPYPVTAPVAMGRASQPTSPTFQAAPQTTNGIAGTSNGNLM